MRAARSLVGFACVIATAALADPPAARRTLALGLDEVVRRAIEASARLVAAGARSEAAGEGVREVRATSLPAIDVSAGYTRRSSVPELTIDLPGAGPTAIFPDLVDNFETRIAADLPLYTGGRVRALVRAAEHERVATRHDGRTTRAEVVLEAHQAYWVLFTAIETERVLSSAMLSFEAHQLDAENRERLGLVARNDVLAVQVERDRAELARIRAAGAVQVAQAELSRLLDLEPGAQVVPSEPTQTPILDLEPVETLVAEALRARSEPQALREAIAAVEERVGAAGAATKPNAHLFGSYFYDDPNRRILPPESRWQDSWEIGARVSLRVFDGGRSAAAVRRSRGEAQALRSDLADLERGVRFQVVSRRRDLETARHAIEVAERNVRAAAENRRVTAERYREGVVLSSELLEAETLLLRAELDRAGSLAETRVALAALERAVGREGN